MLSYLLDYLRQEKSKTDFDFEIEPNEPFYQDSEEFKNKKKLSNLSKIFNF